MTGYWVRLIQEEIEAVKQFEREQRAIHRALVGRLYPGRAYVIEELNRRRKNDVIGIGVAGDGRPVPGRGRDGSG